MTADRAALVDRALVLLGDGSPAVADELAGIVEALGVLTPGPGQAIFRDLARVFRGSADADAEAASLRLAAALAALIAQGRGTAAPESLLGEAVHALEQGDPVAAADAALAAAVRAEAPPGTEDAAAWRPAQRRHAELLRLRAAELAARAGDAVRASALADEVLAARRAEPGDPRALAQALAARARIAERFGDLRAALPLREEALGLARADGEPRLVAEALARLGEVLAGIGDPAAAAPLLDEALALVETAADATAGPDARSRARFAESLARLRVAHLLGDHGERMAAARQHVLTRFAEMLPHLAASPKGPDTVAALVEQALGIGAAAWFRQQR